MFSVMVTVVVAAGSVRRKSYAGNQHQPKGSNHQLTKRHCFSPV
jgi:hypothetical protein